VRGDREFVTHFAFFDNSTKRKRVYLLCSIRRPGRESLNRLRIHSLAFRAIGSYDQRIKLFSASGEAGQEDDFASSGMPGISGISEAEPGSVRRKAFKAAVIGWVTGRM
jgi:hypothetical protein